MVILLLNRSPVELFYILICIHFIVNHISYDIKHHIVLRSTGFFVPKLEFFFFITVDGEEK